MSTTIAITRTDGGVSIMRLADGADVAKEIKKWESANPAHQHIAHVVVADDEIAKEAWMWTHRDGKFSVSMEHARAVTKARLRAERAPKLGALDLADMLAGEDAEEKARIAAEKQRLRDITKLVDDIKDVAALKTLKA